MFWEDAIQGERLGPRPEPERQPVPMVERAPEVKPAPASIGILASFLQNNLGNADGSTPMNRATAGANAAVGYRLPAANKIVGGWVTDVTTGVDGGATGATYWEVEVYVNGAATGIKKRITGSTISDQSTVARYPVRPNDVITCVDSRSGALNAQEGFADVWGRLEWLPAAAGG